MAGTAGSRVPAGTTLASREAMSMNKRDFIRLSSAALAAPFVSPLVLAAQGKRLKNWAGSFEYGTDVVEYPTSLAEVQQVVRRHPRLKVLGTRHCFSDIADSRHAFVSLRNTNAVVALDASAGTVTIEGGMNYGQLCPLLEAKGYAVHNLASLPHISVAGACATATHGSGVTNGNLATAVRALEIVTADGSVIQVSRANNRDDFDAAVVGLGAFGVVTKVTLAIQPTFQVQQYVYEQLPFSQATEHFDTIVSAGYSVSLFTNWQTDSVNEVWVKRRIDDRSPRLDGAAFFSARAATKNLHPIAELSAENCTEQMGVPGPWYERLPHFRMGFTPSSGTELQAEYFVPSRNAVDAIRAIARLGPRIGPHLLISEIRTIAADDLWMSPCHKQASVAIHFTWKQDWPAVRALLPVIERELAPFKARPHWGKLFTVSPAVLASLYERLPAYRDAAVRYDPRGKFRNDFLAKNIFGD
jgi:xylitol oxidase